MTRARIVFTAVCVAALISPMNAGALAQPPAGGVTTVEAVEAVGLVPVPNVGVGAPEMTIEEIQETRVEARSDEVDARFSAQRCNGGFNPTVLQREDAGNFDLAALYATESQTQLAVWRAADAAVLATDAALDARRAAALGQGTQDQVVATELARQDKVLALVAAREAALEAHLRVADLQQAMTEFPNDTSLQRDMVNLRTDQRASLGISGIYIAEEYEDLRLSEIQAVERTGRGGTVMRVTGKINNPRRRAISVPPLLISAIDKYGFPLKTESTDPRGRTRIQPGASVSFVYELTPMPAKAVSAVVTFASEHAQSEQLPVGMFCRTSTD